MKNTEVKIFVFGLIIFFAGCELDTTTDQSLSPSKKGINSYLADYAPVKIKIMPLTKFVEGGSGENPKIEVYVNLVDSFGSQIKYPGRFRFELYEKIIRSPKPKGGRIIMWPDINLVDSAANNKSWLDFMRLYQFNLDFEGKQGNYILQTTFFSENGRILSDEVDLYIKK